MTIFDIGPAAAPAMIQPAIAICLIILIAYSLACGAEGRILR